MRIKLILTSFFVCVAMVSMAADISFVVYTVSGAVSKGSKIKVKKGDKIFANEIILIGDKASVVLVCSNYKAIQLNKKGSYAAKSLLGQCNTTAAGYSSSYFKYVWNEFTHPHGKPETDPGEYMKNTGAVSRGCNSVQTLVSTDTIHFASGTLPVYWSSNFSKPVLAIFDVPVDGGPLKKIVLEKDQPFQMEKLTEGLQPGEYYWQITDGEGNGCERNYLKIWQDSLYTIKMEELLASVPVSSRAETNFARGFVLQQHHFFAEAIQYYSFALQLEPNNKKYEAFLSQFYKNDF